MDDTSVYNNMRILLAEDEEKLRSTVQEYLSISGYRIIEAQNGAEALRVFGPDEREWPDLVLLDLMLPAVNGFDVLAKIREKSDVPVIILTARCSEEEQLKGFALGADDYLTKPFLLSVLKAHIEALLRRTLGRRQRRVFGALTLDEKARKICLDDKLLNLTPREYEVLHFFMRNEKIVLTRDRLLDEIWGIDYNGTDRSVDTIVKQLRLKLGSRAGHRHDLRGRLPVRGKRE